MSVYLIASVDIQDRATYAEYERLAGQTVVAAEGAALVIFDDEPKLLEGALPGQRIVVLRFDTEEQLLTWYNSKPYQDAMKIRLKSGDTKFLLTAKGLA